MNLFETPHKHSLSSEEVSERIANVLRDAGIRALITGAAISAKFPDGESALFKDLEVDTE